MGLFRIPIFIFLFAIILSRSIADDDESESEEFAVTLDRLNFTDFVATHKFILVEFYAPWCGHCKKLAPELEKAASFLSTLDPPVVIAKIDATDEINKPFADEFGIRGFPTLRILRYGGSVVQEYKGPRDSDGIITYLKKLSGPATFEIKSAKEATSVIDSYKILVAGVFLEFSGEHFDNFTTVAERLQADYEFGYTLDAKLLPHGDSSSAGPLVRLFKPFDELFVDFQDFNVDALAKFVEETSIPTVTLYDKYPKHRPFVVNFFKSTTSKAMLFLNFSTDQYDAFESKFRDVAALYKGHDLNFLMGDVEASKSTIQFFGLKDDQVPLIIIFTSDRVKYLKTNVEPDHIESWVTDLKDGKVEPYRKSEPIPEANDDPVMVVVADTLQELVLDSEKNVLLEFYAPWCGHCKKLAPILDEVAVSFEDDAHVVIAKIDATENDYPKETFIVKGYPTLYFKSSSGNMIKYEGGRTKEAIFEFIEKNRDSIHEEL